jgi:hypothetical protein
MCDGSLYCFHFHLGWLSRLPSSSIAIFEINLKAQPLKKCIIFHRLSILTGEEMPLEGFNHYVSSISGL